MEAERKKLSLEERDKLIAAVKKDAGLLRNGDRQTRFGALERLVSTMQRDLPIRVRRAIFPHLESVLRDSSDPRNRAFAVIGIINSDLPEASRPIHAEIFRKPASHSLILKSLEEIVRLRNSRAKRNARATISAFEPFLRDEKLMDKAHFAIKYLRAPEVEADRGRKKYGKSESAPAQDAE